MGLFFEERCCQIFESPSSPATSGRRYIHSLPPSTAPRVSPTTSPTTSPTPSPLYIHDEMFEMLFKINPNTPVADIIDMNDYSLEIDMIRTIAHDMALTNSSFSFWVKILPPSSHKTIILRLKRKKENSFDFIYVENGKIHIDVPGYHAPCSTRSLVSIHAKYKHHNSNLPFGLLGGDILSQRSDNMRILYYDNYE